MTALITRLLGAIEAKEQKARRVKADWHQVGETGVIVASDGGRNAEECGNGNWAGIAEFMVDNDPSSVLRRCEADRKLVELYREVEIYDDADCQDDPLADRAGGLGEAVRLLAQGYGITEEEK